MKKLFKIYKKYCEFLEKSQRNTSGGFTIVEAIVAIFILTVSIASMLSLTASSATSARYANNAITANFLLQEGIDSVRNSRDSIAFQQKDTGGGWIQFLTRYGYPSLYCFSSSGCYLKIESYDPTNMTYNDIGSCSGTCPYLIYNSADNATIFYSGNGTGVTSNFRRTIKMTKVSDDEVKVIVTVDWKNGTSTKTQTLEESLLNWQN